MADLPAVSVGKHPLESYLNKNNKLADKSRIVGSSDITVTRTPKGTILRLSERNKLLLETMRFKDIYDYNAAYSVNDVVIVEADTHVVFKGKTYDLTAGLWICQAFVPEKTWSDRAKASGLTRAQYPSYIRDDNAQYFPVYPAPTNLATVNEPQGRYWRLMVGWSICND
jgi:hypothetical protein